MTMTGVTPTLSPQLDIQISINFERLLFDLYGRDGKALADGDGHLQEPPARSRSAPTALGGVRGCSTPAVSTTRHLESHRRLPPGRFGETLDTHRRGLRRGPQHRREPMCR